MINFLAFFTFERLVILFFVSLLAFVGLTFAVGFEWSWMFLLLCIILIVRYFLLGTVGAAGRHLQNQDFAKAEQVLSWTKKPEWLMPGINAMYYFLKSALMQQKNDMSSAETYLKKSVDLGLPDNETNAMAHVNLAALYLNKNRPKEAKEYYQKAKDLQPSTPQIKEALRQMDTYFKQQGKIPMYQQIDMHNNRGGRVIRK